MFLVGPYYGACFPDRVSTIFGVYAYLGIQQHVHTVRSLLAFVEELPNYPDLDVTRKRFVELPRGKLNGQFPPENLLYGER